MQDIIVAYFCRGGMKQGSSRKYNLQLLEARGGGNVIVTYISGGPPYVIA